MMAIVSKGDALDPVSVSKAFEGEVSSWRAGSLRRLVLEKRLTLAGWCRCPVDMEEVDAVITTIGGTTKSPEADSQGNINLIEAALKKGVRKFIMVSSIGAGDSKNATPPEVLR